MFGACGFGGVGVRECKPFGWGFRLVGLGCRRLRVWGL